MALTEPTFAVTDPSIIMAEVVSDFEAMTGRKIYPAQPEYIICSCLAYHKSLAMARVNEAGKAVLVDFAAAPVLDYLAAMFDIQRLDASSAVCTIRFTLVDGHSQVTIPLGTRVASTDGLVIFETTEDATVIVGVNTVDILCECQTAGVIGNNYGVGAISVLQDVYAYIVSVANIDITQGGAEEESDEQLRNRVKLATSKFSVAGSTNAYIYWTKTASSLIVDVNVQTMQDFIPITSYTEWVDNTEYSYGDIVLSGGILFACIKDFTSTTDPILDNDNWVTAGQVNIYALLKDGEIPSPSLNATIESVLTSEEIRPLTDNVMVKSAVDAEYTLTVNVVKYPDASSDLQTQISNIIDAYGLEKKQFLGKDIIATEIEQLCRVSGVYDVTVTIVPTTGTLTGRNLAVKSFEVAKLTGKTVTITGSNNG